jgi:hypothetical protein
MPSYFYRWRKGTRPWREFSRCERKAFYRENERRRILGKPELAKP